MFKVTPWEVTGKIDYMRLVRDFGTEIINNEILRRIEKYGKLHILLKRKFFFSHRDLNKVIDSYENGYGFFLYTGRGPSGRMHIAHMLPFLFTKWLQDVFDVNLYIQITDDEKFLLSRKKIEEVEKIAKENMLDIAAIGFNPNKTFMFKDSEFIGNFYKLTLRIARHINFSTVKGVFGFKKETNIGMLFFPSIQASPAFFEKKICLIPCGIDQDPYWRITRDIAPKLGFKKPAAIHSKFLPSLLGITEKMSSSKENSAIFLNDTPEVVEEKIMKHAYSGGQPSIKEQRKKGANLDIDISFQWLSIFFEENDKKLLEIKNRYEGGDMLTWEIKKYLIEKINIFLEKHRRRKENAEKNMEKIMYDGKLARDMWEKNIE